MFILKRCLLALCMATGIIGTALAAELPTFTLTFKPDGTFEPARREVPAGSFKLELINESKEAVEVERLPLRKENVMGPGVKTCRSEEAHGGKEVVSQCRYGWSAHISKKHKK